LNLKHVQDIFCGRYHSFATIGDKKLLYAWGLNNNGQLGIGFTGDAYKPTPVAGELSEKSVI
jgi:alpha-tubulin suppressor-like RCC1 family protein